MTVSLLAALRALRLSRSRVAAVLTCALLGVSLFVQPSTVRAAGSLALSFSTSVNVSHDAQASLQSSVKVDSTGRVHMVWMGYYDQGAPFTIKYSNSDQQGVEGSWSDPITLSANGSHLSSTMTDVAMAVDVRNHPHILWGERDNRRNLHLYYVRMKDDGNFTDKVAISTVAVGRNDPYSGAGAIDIAVDPSSADLIHVAWKGANGANKSANWGIYYTNSVDGGLTWKNFSAVSTTSSNYGDIKTPVLLAEPNGNIHASWNSSKFGVEANHGVWNAQTQTMTWKYTGSQKRENLARYGNNTALGRDPNTGVVYIAFMTYSGSYGSGGRGIKLARYTAAEGWSPSFYIADGPNAGVTMDHPTIAVTKTGTVYVGYTYYASSIDAGVYYTASTNGINWPAPTTSVGRVTDKKASAPVLVYSPDTRGREMMFSSFSARVGGPDSSGQAGYDIVYRSAVMGTNAPAPTISSVAPTSAVNNGNATITINGSNFQAGATVLLGATALNVTNVTATAITATVPAGLAVGTYSVKVTNPDGQSATLANAFTVTAPAPTITNVSPNSGSTKAVTLIRVTGSNFTQGLTAKLGGTSLSFVAVSADGSYFYAEVPAGLAPNAYDLTVTVTGGQSATQTGAFTVIP